MPTEPTPAWVSRGSAAVKTAEGEYFEGVGPTEDAARSAAYALARKHIESLARRYRELTTAGDLPAKDQDDWSPPRPPSWQDPLFILASKTPPSARWKSREAAPSILVRVPLTAAVETTLKQANPDSKIDPFIRHHGLMFFDLTAVQSGPEPAWVKRGSAAVKSAEGRFFEGVGFGPGSSEAGWRNAREMARHEIRKLAQEHIAAASWKSPPYMPAPTPEEMKINSERPRPWAMKAWRKPLEAALLETPPSATWKLDGGETCVLLRFSLDRLLEAVAKMEGVEQKELDYFKGRAQAAFDEMPH